MIKFFSAVFLFIVLSSSYWMAKLDTWPFILRHPAPEKLNLKISEDFGDVLFSRGIESIRFGSNNSHQRAKISVEVSGEIPETQLINNPKLGVVWVSVDVEHKHLQLYWNVPDNMVYSEAHQQMSSLLTEIISQNDEARTIRNSFK